MQYLPEFLTVALVHFLAVISPGPDFILITRNSLIYSRRSGLFSALGLGLGILVHVTYSLLGIALIISQSVLLFNIMKFLGAAYLIYIGYRSLMSKKIQHNDLKLANRNQLTDFASIKMGFITNVTNPKATLFFFSLFTLVINPYTPTIIKTLYGVEMAIVTTAWFTFVALIFSHSLIKDRISKIQHYAEKLMGGLLILLGIKLAFTHK